MSIWTPKWCDINDIAPKTGAPIWVRGYNYGDSKKGEHFAWAYWDEGKQAWYEAGPDSSELVYLTAWMDLS